MIKQTTLHNILTWAIAVILFIFQSLNYFIAWIKKYLKHGEKITTVVTADTTISSESNPNNKNAQENVITVQRLIQKHFDIPLIIAEDEPKVYNFIKSAQLLTSNEICKEKKKIDKFMENLVDDSYVARGLGLITATVGRQSEFYLYSKYDNDFENIVIKLNGRNGEVGEITILNQNPAEIVKTKAIPIDYFYDKDRIKVTYTPFAEGVYTLTLVRNSLSICRSPYYISVEKSPTNSRSQIRLGTKKYKPVTKFAKAKHSSLETCDNSTPAIELNKPSICRNILPVSEENSIRTDVMSIVTKFESNSMSVQKKVHKHAPSIPEKCSETNLIDDISTYLNIKPKIKTDNVYYNNVSDLNSHNAQSKSKSTDNNFCNDVDITYINSKESDINAVDFERKPMTNFNKNIRITKDIPWVKDVSSTHLKPTNSVLEESLNDWNSNDVEKRLQTFKTADFIDENTHSEALLNPTTRIDEYDIKCIDNEPCIQNELSCFDDDDRKTVVVMENFNELESNKNDTVIQQITDSAQYNINTPFASVITKITNSVCEKCSIQVLKIISEFPRDINITHDNSKEISSSFEALLAQPISININIDNMFEHPISAANEQNSKDSLTNSPTKIKRMGTTDKDMKCQYLNEIEPINNNSDELCGDINNSSKELTIKTNKPNSKVSKTIKDKIIDHCAVVPFTENTIDKNKTVDQKNEWSTNKILEIKCSTTNEENVLHSNQFNNDTIYKPDNEMEIQGRHLQKSSEHKMGLIKINQFHENINNKLNNINKESDKSLSTSDLVTINNDKNINEELVRDEFKINNVIIPDKNTNIQSSVIDNTVLASMGVTLETSKYSSEDNEEQTKNLSFKNVTSASNANENQKLMIEKSIEPVLTSFKNKMVEKITQLYLNKDLSNTVNTTIVETNDKHLTNILKENQIHNIENNTEINTKCIETLTSQLQNHIDKNEISEIILDEKKMANNHLLKYVENIIKTNINPSDMYAQTLGEKKLWTLVNTAMNNPNDQKIDNGFKQMIKDNETQYVKLKKINNGKIVQDILAETENVTIIKNTDKLTASKNEVTVKAECKLPLINDFNSIERDNTNTDIEHEMQTINENENFTMIETNTVEIQELPNFQKSHNTAIITPIIELQPTLETQIMNTSELVTVGEHSLKAIQSAIEIIQSNISEETDEIENIDDKRENKSVKLQIKENENIIIKIPHLVEKKTINEIVENISSNTSTKSNSTKNVSMQQTKKQEIETSESTLSPKHLYIMKNIMLEKKENTDETCTPDGTEIETLEFFNEPLKMNSVPPFTNDTSVQTTLESKTEKNTLHKTFDSKHNVTTTESIVNEINHNNNKNETTRQISSTAGEIEEKPIKNHTEIECRPLIDAPNEPDEMLIDTKAETPGFIVTPTASLVRKIVVEFVTRMNKKPVETLAIVVHDQIEENIVTAREIPTTMNSLTVVMDEQVNIKTHESSTYYAKVDDKIKTTETKTQISIDQKNADKIIEKEPEVLLQINSIKGVIVEKPKVNFSRENQKHLPTVTSTNSTEEMEGINKLIITLPIQSTIEYLDVSKEIEDINETEKTSCTNYSTVTVEESPEPIDSSDGVVGENTKDNIDTGNEKLLPIDTSPGPVNQNRVMDELIEKLSNMESNVESIEKSLKDINVTAVINTDSANVILNVQTEEDKVIGEEPKDSIDEKNIEEPPAATVNYSDKAIAKNTNENIDTEKQTFLPIKTSTPLIKELKVKEGTTEITLPIKSTMQSIEEPKEEKDLTETKITSCTESSMEIIDDQNRADLIVNQKSPAENNSSDEVQGENKNVNIDIDNATPLPIVSFIESITEPTMAEEMTETEVSCNDSSIVIVHPKIDVVEEHDERNVIPINSSNKVDGEKIDMNIDTEKETLLITKTTSDLVEELEVIKETTEIVLPIESSIESIDKPKVVEDKIVETEITSSTKSSTEMMGDQNHVDRIVFLEPPYEDNSSNVIVEENTTVNIDTENKTTLFIEPIVEPEMDEDRTEKETLSFNDSSTATIEAQSKKEKYIEEESPVSINSSDELVGENTNMNIDTEKETLLPIKSSIESIDEIKVVEHKIVETEITSSTKSSTEMNGNQNHVDRIVFQEPPYEDNSSNEIVEENTTVNIDTENKTTLFIEPIVEPEMDEDRTEKETLSFNDSSTATIEAQSKKEKYTEEESPVSINSSDELVGENTNMNIDTEKETLLPIKSSIESIDEIKVVEHKIVETEITSSTKSSTEMNGNQNHVDRIVFQEPPYEDNSSNEIVEENTTVNIDTENKTTLFIEPIVEPEMDEDRTEKETLSFNDSSTATIEAQSKKEKYTEEESPVSINSSDELVGENTNMNIDTEKETLLPIKSSIESIDEIKVVEHKIVETEITSSTKSSTEMNGNQNHVDRIVFQEPPYEDNSSNEIVEENTTVNIDTENKTTLFIEPIVEPEMDEDRTEKETLSFNDSSTATIEAQSKKEKYTEEESPVSINSSDELVGENTNMNIGTEKETLLPIESSIESIKEPRVVEDKIVETEIKSCTESSTEMNGNQNHVDITVLKEPPYEGNSSNEIVEENMTVNNETENKTPSFIEPIAEPEIDEYRTEKETLSFTDSSNIVIDVEKVIGKEYSSQISVGEKSIKKKHMVPNYSSGELLEKNQKLNIHTENETPLNIESVIEFIVESVVVDDKTEIEKSCNDFSTVTVDAQTKYENCIEEESPAPINCSDEVARDKKNVKVDIENVTPLPFESIIGSIAEPMMAEDITETEISCTDSSIVIVHSKIDVVEGHDERNVIPINSSNKVDDEKIDMNIDTEKKTLLITKTTSDLVEELEVIKETTEIVLPIESSIESIDKPKVVEDKIVETEITSSTKSSTEMMGDQNHVDRIVFQEPPYEDNSSNEIVEENTTVNIDTENKTTLFIEPIVEPEMDEDRTEKETLSFTDSSTETIQAQLNKVKYTEEESSEPNNSSNEVVGEKSYMNIEVIDDQNHTNTNIDQEPLVSNNSSDEVVGENTNIPIGIIIESREVSKVNIKENIFETEKTPCINSSAVSVNVQTYEEKNIKREYPTPITFLGKILDGNTKVNIDAENESLLLIESNEESVLEPKVEKDTVTVDVQAYVEKVVEEESSSPINSFSEVVEEYTNGNVDIENETILQIDISTAATNSVIEEKVTENEYSISSFLVAGKQINIIDSETETLSSIETYMTFVDEPNVVGYLSVNEHEAHIDSSSLKKQIKIDSETEIETLSLVDNLTESVKEQIVEKITENKTPTLIDCSSEIVLQGNKVDMDTDSQTPLPINKFSTTVVDQIVKNVIENETPTYCLVDVSEEQTKVNIKNNIETFTPIDICTSSVGKQLNVEYLSENEHTAQIEKESRNETSTPVNYSTSITIEQTDLHNLAERTLPNDDILSRNTKTNSIDRDSKTENSDNSNNCYLKFGETSKIRTFENEDNLQRKSYGIQKLEMSVQRMKTSDEDYYEKTFVQLEQTEKISKVDDVNVDGENKTTIDDKLYTVNESDLNAILCASSLEQALTLLDSKIKFKFKHKKSSKINAMENIPKIQTSESQSSGVNTNFTDAREFFKEIEKKSKK
ncbi:uncharacterized protein LOC111039503 [Myzus persicae]|uniref:uncharacterized protein LOC111039503 n=1 Tax=Myzus persicae TaxID=13164 RepID=UPI000B934759|nr:uncharacterized protein LOC111039503 [Myzus persicae]